jgi:hypothetical protein
LACIAPVLPAGCTLSGFSVYWSGSSLYDGQITWSRYGGSDFEIFLWDGSSISQITDNDFDNRAPSIYNGEIVWYGGTNSNDNEINYFDGLPIHQLTSNS